MPLDFAAIRDRYSFRDIVTFAEDAAGLVSATLDLGKPYARAKVFLQGAHVTEFEPRDSGPVLFTSSRSHFTPGKPIRGGVPIVFPWFGPHAGRPGLPAHGFARTLPWQVDDVLFTGGDRVGLALILAASDVTRRLWPHDFGLRFTVVVGRTLEMSLDVDNRGTAPFTFEAALHTYLAVGDVRRASVEGLDGRGYVDKVDGMKRKTQSGPVHITGETDRVYLNTPDTVTVHDPAAGRRIVVEKTGSATTVVWNPWVEKAKAMPDFGDDEWPQMLCVETASAAENAVTVGPKNSHSMRATVRVE